MKGLVRRTMGSFTEYKVDQKELDFWFDHINNEVFNGEVPYPHIVDIRRQSKTWGYVKQVEVNGVQVVGLFMQPTYPTLGAFLQILAHEMVHVWQLMVNGDTGNHNKHFYSWRETFKEHNLDLKRCY
jgi:hypothetical protein